MVAQSAAKKPQSAGGSGASKKAPRLTYLGDLKQQPRPVVPTVLLQRAQPHKAAGGDCSDAKWARPPPLAMRAGGGRAI